MILSFQFIYYKMIDVSLCVIQYLGIFKHISEGYLNLSKTERSFAHIRANFSTDRKIVRAQCFMSLEISFAD